MKAVCFVTFVLLNVLVRVIDGVKPKSVNLALETVLQFDRKNYDVDVNVINKVQKFLDTVKKHVVKNGRRRSSNHLKLTDFIKESAKILKECKDSDLEDMFAVLDDEIRKYHYKGCKFYELVEDVDVRRYMTTQLAQAKGAKGGELKKGLEKVVITIENDTFNGKDKSLMQMLNSLYTGSDRIFRSVLHGLEKYKVKGAEGMNLPQFLSSSLRTLLFDHYSNLNSNARENVKNVVNSYLKPTNAKVLYGGGNGNKKAGLRTISVNGFTNKAMNAWSRYMLRNTKPTYRPVLRDIADNVFEIMETKQKRYKVTGTTEETEAPTTTEVTTTEVTTTEPTTTPTTTPRVRSTVLSFNDEDYTTSESQETETVLPKGKGKKHVLRMKSTTQDDEELFLNPREFTMLFPEKDYSVERPLKKNKKYKPKVVEANENEKESLTIEIVGNNAKGAASIDIISSETTTDANRLEIIERDFDAVKDNIVNVKAKKRPFVESQVTNYYGQAINSHGGFFTDEEADLKQDPLSLEHLSIETKARESIEVDTDSAGLLVGGQDIKTMIYRSDLVTKKVSVQDYENKDNKLKHIDSHTQNNEKNDGNIETANVHEHKLNIKHKENQDKVTKNKTRHNRHKDKKSDDPIGIESFMRNVMKNDFKGVETVGYKVKNPEERKEIRPSDRHKEQKHEETVELETVARVVHQPKKDVKWGKVVVMKPEHSKEVKPNDGDKVTKPQDSVEIKFVGSFGHKPQKHLELKNVSHKPKSEEPQEINVRYEAKKHKKLIEVDNLGSVDRKQKKRVKSDELGIIKSKEVIKPSQQHKIRKPKYSIGIDNIRSVDQQLKKQVNLTDTKELKSEKAVEIKANLGYKLKKDKDFIEVDAIRSVGQQPKKHIKSKDTMVRKSEEAVEIKPNLRYKVKKRKDSIEIDDKRSVKSKDIEVTKFDEAVEIRPNLRYKVKKHKNSIEIGDKTSVDNEPNKHVESEDDKAKSAESEEIRSRYWYKFKKHEEPVLKAHEINKNIEPYATRNKEDTSEQIQEILTEHSAVIKVEAPRRLKESATSGQKKTQKPVHDEAKHIRKHKKASHKKKTHKPSSSEVEVNARRSLNNIETQEALGAILRPNPNAQTDKGGLKIKEPFGAKESQQAKHLDEKEASNLLDKTRQEKIYLASSIASLISTAKPKEKQEVIDHDNVEKIVTPTKIELINVSTPWTNVNTKPAPLVRRQDNQDVSSNAVNKETPPHVQADVGKIIDNINMISKDNITSDTLANLFKLKDMIVTHPELKEKWNSIQTLNNVQSKTQETSTPKSFTEDSSQNQPPKDFSQMKDSVLSMMHTNADNWGNVTSGTTKVGMAVTAKHDILGDDMKKQWDTLKKEWDSLKTNMALKDPITTKVTQEPTLN